MTGKRICTLFGSPVKFMSARQQLSANSGGSGSNISPLHRA
jgi:hypothetical protein